MSRDSQDSAVPSTARALSAAYRAGSLSPLTAVRSFLSRIESLDPALNCFITVLGDSAAKAAEESERRLKAGNPIGPLDGIPVAVKDLIYIEGVRCTAGSKILRDNVAPYDAGVVRRLRAAGAVLIGTTNLHEFAAGVTGVNPHFGAVKNPWDLSRVSGGSSAGSAVAVAGGLSPVAIGTDTGGSVRIPAGLCGIVGLKPTYGRVSRLGVVPLSSSFDTVGVLAASVWDASVVMQAIAGHEKDDMTTVEAEVPDYLSMTESPLPRTRVGVVRTYFHDGIDPTVEGRFGRFVERLRAIGCEVRDLELEWIPDTYYNWQPIRKAEAIAYHRRWFESSPELYGEDVRRLLEDGKSVLAVDYVGAINARPSYMEKFTNAMADFDFLAVPTTSITAPKLDQGVVKIGGKEVDVRTALIKPSIPFNYLGCPVLELPSEPAGGLPVGAQVVGKLFGEGELLRLGQAYESKFGPFPLPRLSAE